MSQSAGAGRPRRGGLFEISPRTGAEALGHASGLWEVIGQLDQIADEMIGEGLEEEADGLATVIADLTWQIEELADITRRPTAGSSLSRIASSGKGW